MAVNRDTRNFSIYYGLWGEIFYHTYIVLIMMKLKYFIQMYKRMFPAKNGLNSTIILYRGTRKSLLIHSNGSKKIRVLGQQAGKGELGRHSSKSF